MNTKSFPQLCREEPYRIFFPLGLLIGATGVLLWPLFLLGATSTYPAMAHARLMMEGMMSCFIFGFLGTAGPRVLSAPHFSGAEVLRLAALITGATLAHLYGWHAFADTLFLLALVLFVASLARRFLRRKDSPPPNFALVGLGILNGVAGTALLVFCEWTASAPTLSRLGSSLLNVGFVLLPVLGVAPFFLRRLLDLTSEDDIAQTRRPKLVVAIFVGLTIDASLALELFSSHPAIGWIRCATALGYIVMTLPRRGSNTLATSLRMSLAAVAAALGLMAILPAYRISALHVLFIGGFSVALFSVATRVVLGHSGHLHLVRERRWLFLATLVLSLLAMIVRFSADFVATRNEHLMAAALCWLCAAALWGALVLPHVTRVAHE